jgi:hypothetical protein
MKALPYLRNLIKQKTSIILEIQISFKIRPKILHLRSYKATKIREDLTGLGNATTCRIFFQKDIYIQQRVISILVETYLLQSCNEE